MTGAVRYATCGISSLLIRRGCRKAESCDRPSNEKLVCVVSDVCPLAVRRLFGVGLGLGLGLRGTGNPVVPCDGGSPSIILAHATDTHACLGDEVPVAAEVRPATAQTGSRAHTPGDCPIADESGQEGWDQGLASCRAAG
jgi:hypothetical protein